VMLGVLTVWFGLRLTWASINGPFLQCLKQVLIVIIALMLGRMTGGLLNLQKMSNRLGRRASERLAAAKPDDPHLRAKVSRLVPRSFARPRWESWARWRMV